jgi:hypothetical protein
MGGVSKEYTYILVSHLWLETLFFKVHFIVTQQCPIVVVAVSKDTMYFIPCPGFAFMSTMNPRN